ncbi:flagellar hook-associated protein 2 [Bacillus sp. HNG]|uniref:flagellar hook-associated protein 2 n=1 Tax=Bacillus sp. HNG TaxID=2293325 RepID=UPI000E2FCA43|nr:flagellar hook-associated protein 2 [Bacillus sp. HNG]RFB09491.1 flagellar hook-associated protein 2 [Bacillus sp. HNG]
MVRIGGLASGMDIDSIVKDLMKAERIPLDKMQQKKQYLEWQRDDYRDMNKQLLDFDTFIFDKLMMKTTYTKKNITSSNDAAVSARSISATNEISGSITVSQLAKGASMQSASNTGFKLDQKLSDLALADNSITIKAIKKDGTFDEVGYTITFDPAQETINSLISKINSNTGVSAFFDSVTGKISLTTKYTGDAKDATGNDQPEIQLSGDFFTKLQLDTDNIVAQSFLRGSIGQDAKFNYNGLETSRSSNTFQINGYEYTLKQVTGDPVTFSSSPDVDSILSTIVTFVDKYNELIGNINSKTIEKPNRNYQPLTDAQKEDMTEEQIEKWEKEARKGTLYRDSILISSTTIMRQQLYSNVSGLSSDFNQLSDIGITTSKNYMDKGKLIIDEGKLREAISNNPNGIYELFQKDGTTTEEKGLARRLRDSIKESMNGIELKAGKAYSNNNTFTIGRNLDNMDDRIDSFEARLLKIEDRYWRQFTEMEKAIQKANSQAAYLMQQFSY